MTKNRILESAFVSCALLCVGLAAAQTPDPALQAALKSSFRAEGIAGLDRIDQDPIQALCSDPSMKSSPQGQAKMEALQKASLAEIKPPTDGKYLGDWKRGEALAQNGRGATWSDALGKRLRHMGRDVRQRPAARGPHAYRFLDEIAARDVELLRDLVGRRGDTQWRQLLQLPPDRSKGDLLWQYRAIAHGLWQDAWGRAADARVHVEPYQ